jgi:NADH dehydrogenase FAD-containing subunit
VTVVGGGLSGIELAAELRERWPGLPLTLFAAGELGPDLSQRVSLLMAVAAADDIARRRAGLPEQPFEFSDGGVCISLGRRLDSSLLKETVCRFTVRRMSWERWVVAHRVARR